MSLKQGSNDKQFFFLVQVC